MYNKFETCLFDFCDESEPSDYWYDCAVVEATEILKQFNDNDWKLLLEQSKNKSLFWQKRVVECLGDLHNPYELELILNLIDIDDEDFFITCIDSLRLCDLSILDEAKKIQLLLKVKTLLTKATPPLKQVLQDFMKKMT